MLRAVDSIPALWSPALLMILAIWLGLLYNNKRPDDFNNRLDDFRDMLMADIGRSEEKLRADMPRSQAEMLAEIRRSHAELSADIRRVAQAVARLEAAGRTFRATHFGQLTHYLRANCARACSRFCRAERSDGSRRTACSNWATACAILPFLVNKTPRLL